jgi:O-antigen ligase
MVGFNGAKDQIGAFFAITLPIVIRYIPILIPLSLLAIFASHSSFALVAAIVSGLIYLFYTKRLYFNVVLASIIIVSAVFFTSVDKLNSKDFKQRFDVWKYSIKSTIQGKIGISDGTNNITIKTNPIYGYGLGNFLRVFPYIPTPKGTCFNVVNEKFTHAHNDYVEAFFEFGWVGFVLMTVFAFAFVFSFVTSSKSNDIVLYFFCLMAYFLNASGNFLSHLGVSGLFLIILYGMYRGALNDKG